MKRHWFVAVALVALIATGAHATVPSTLSYQGVLTDNVGAIQPDGLYNFVFKIYNVGSGGSALWTETDNNVQLTKGSFTVLLGNVTSLSALAFDVPYYLGISVNGQPELVPRVPLASSAYGLSLRLPFTGIETSSGALFTIVNQGGGPDILADHHLQVGSGSVDGFLSLAGVLAPFGLVNLYPYGGLATTPERVGVVASLGGAIDLFDTSGNTTMTFEPDVDGLGGGYMTVTGSVGDGSRFTVNGNGDGAGNPFVGISGLSQSAFFDMGLTGDAAVALPGNAIDAFETLDEAGVAQGKTNLTVNVTNQLNMVDIVTTSITIPSSGYIVLTAHAQAGLGGTTSSNYIIAQIDDTPGGSEDINHSEWVGGSGFGTSGGYYLSYSNTRTYFEGSAGTYSFRFEAQKGTATGSCYFYNPTLTAEYLPTGYGTVTTVTSAADAGRFASPQPVTGMSQDGRTRGSGMVVDLRELELQVAREQARLAATRERLRAARDARQTPGVSSARLRNGTLKRASGGQ